MENQESAPGPAPTSTGMDPKTVGIISYLTLIGLIIAIVINNGNKSEQASFHIRQMLGLFVMSLGSYILILIPVIGWLLYIPYLIFLVVLWVIGFIGAINGEEKLIPVVGEKFQEWFKGL